MTTQTPEHEYDDLRWLARDARQKRRRSLAWSAGMVGAAMFVATTYVATNDQSNNPGQVPPDLAARLDRIEQRLDLLIQRPLFDAAAILIPTGERFDAVERSIERLDPSRQTRGLISDQLNELELAASRIETLVGDLSGPSPTVAHTNHLYWIASDPPGGIWRFYPMRSGDTLWIPDGDFYVRLDGVRDQGQRIDVAVYLAGAGQPVARAWQLDLRAEPPIPEQIGDYSVSIYYADTTSTRPGFGSPYVDIAICWTDIDRPEVVCPDRPLENPASR